VAEITDAVDHHIQMISVWQIVAISLIYTAMQLMCRLSDALYLWGIFLHQCLIFSSCHIAFFMFLQAKIIKIERNAKGKFVFFSFPFGFHAFIFIKNVLGTRPSSTKKN
jgi:hypothetical protein